MRASRWARSAVLTGICLLAMGTPLMVGVSAASDRPTPPWEPDASAAAPYGNLTFYDASGNPVTSGTSLSSPFSYVVAGTAGDTGATKGTVSYANPEHGVLPASWTVTNEAGPTTFSPASGLPGGTPADIAAFAPTYPVVAVTPPTQHHQLAGVEHPRHHRRLRQHHPGPPDRLGSARQGQHDRYLLGVRHRLQHDIVADHRRRHHSPGQRLGPAVPAIRRPSSTSLAASPASLRPPALRSP